MKAKMKILCVFALFLIGVLAVSGIANADSVPVTIEKVYIDDKAVEDGETRSLDRGSEEVEVEVKLLATGDDEHVTVEATIEGLDHDRDEASDKTESFSVKAGKTYYKKLNIALPGRMDVDEYALRVEVSNRKDDEIIYNAYIAVDPVRNGIRIKDIVFSPEGAVKAGRSLLATVRLKNVGESTEEDVKVKVEMPELGISASDYIDEVEEEDSVTSEELYMRIPECAKAGEYRAVVTVEFDEGDETISEESTVTVVESETCAVGAPISVEKTVIAVSEEVQDVVAGESGVIYPLTITNSGTSSRTYAISAKAGDWADVKVSPSLAVLNAGETKIVYVQVAAKEGASAGEQVFGIAVKSGETLLKEVTMKANVVESKGRNWTRGLEYALIALVVLLVIIGLVIGFSRLKGGNESEEEEQTYY